jgi:hypothetical protein
MRAIFNLNDMESTKNLKFSDWQEAKKSKPDQKGFRIN